MKDDGRHNRDYASPPCYAHELDPLYRDLAAPGDGSWADVNRWRKAERERLLALRAALDADQREAELARVCQQLDALLQSSGVTVLGAYWPMHGEPDLRRWMAKQADSGLTIALPVIRSVNQPLQYSRWHPRCAMRRGRWGIAEPAEDNWVQPPLVLAPLVGADQQRHRLGFGGGYFDRSLAAASPRRQAIGVGFSCARITTIYPQAHDVAMDAIVTG